MPRTAGWIEDGRIYSLLAKIRRKFYIENELIYGPDGPLVYTIVDGRIYNADNAWTGFWIDGAWIFGPSSDLPFASELNRQQDSLAAAT